jgi:hypothetical protein
MPSTADPRSHVIGDGRAYHNKPLSANQRIQPRTATSCPICLFTGLQQIVSYSTLGREQCSGNSPLHRHNPGNHFGNSQREKYQDERRIDHWSGIKL